MFNYIKSELYRVKHSKNIFVMGGICTAILLALNIVLGIYGRKYSDFGYSTTAFSFSMVASVVVVVFIFTLCLGSMVFADEYKNKTIMNSVAYGYSKISIYIGKIIVSTLVAAVLLTAALAVYTGSAYLLLENSGMEPLSYLLISYVANIPVLLAGLWGAITLLFLVNSVGGAIWSWLGLFLGVPIVCEILGMKIEFFAEISKWLVYGILQEVIVTEDGYLPVYMTEEGLFRCLLAGFIGIAVFLLLGTLGVRKKELK